MVGIRYCLRGSSNHSRHRKAHLSLRLDCFCHSQKCVALFFCSENHFLHSLTRDIALSRVILLYNYHHNNKRNYRCPRNIPSPFHRHFLYERDFHRDWSELVIKYTYINHFFVICCEFQLLQNCLDNSLYPVRPIYFGAATAAACAFYSNNSSGLLNLLPTVGEGTIARVD